jgi:hypothetical protein
MFAPAAHCTGVYPSSGEELFLLAQHEHAQKLAGVQTLDVGCRAAAHTHAACETIVEIGLREDIFDVIAQFFLASREVYGVFHVLPHMSIKMAGITKKPVCYNCLAITSLAKCSKLLS